MELALGAVLLHDSVTAMETVRNAPRLETPRGVITDPINAAIHSNLEYSARHANNLVMRPQIVTCGPSCYLLPATPRRN
jgi:hypothetical protein